VCGRETKDRILLHRQCEHKCEQLGYAAASLYAHETLHTTQVTKDDTAHRRHPPPPVTHYSHLSL